MGEDGTQVRGFEEFYSATQRRVLRAVALVAATEEDARDCVQEAYVRAADRWPGLRDGTAEAWVRRVALVSRSSVPGGGSRHAAAWRP